MTLDDLRNDIDRVDEVLVRLLNERARCVCEIGRLKKQTNMEVYQPDREKQVLRARAGRSPPKGRSGPTPSLGSVRAHHRRGTAAERRVVHGEIDEAGQPAATQE